MKLKIRNILTTFVAVILLMQIGSVYGQVAQSEFQPMKNKADDLLTLYQYESALNTYKEIVAKEPGFANCYYNMAICYNQMNQFDQAYSALEKFVALQPQDSEAYFNMAMLQVQLGDNNKARALLIKAAALHPAKDLKRRIQDARDHLEPSPFPEDSLEKIKSYYGR